MASRDLIFRFLGVDAGAGTEFDRMASKSSATAASFKKLAVGAGAVAAVIGVESIKMAAQFQTAVTRIHTQADATVQQTQALAKGFLAMAGSVATTPAVLADAGYHIASVGQKSLTTAQQLAILKMAAEGAKLGGANLTDVTNALDAALVAHIKGVHNYSQAMGVLNSTVGAGDMTMQDLADAFGPLGSTFKGFGVSIQQAGAALATFGDNNLRGAMAGSQLRQSITALADPLKNGQAQLQAWGIKSGNLAAQLAHGGLTEALAVLRQKMTENGITAEKMGPKLAEMFGKRGPQQGLSMLLNEFDRYKTKLKEVTDGGNNFASSWKGYTQTFGYALDSARSSVESLMIQLGTKLLPYVTEFANWISQKAVPAIQNFAGWVSRLSPQVKILAGVLLAVGAAFAFPVTAAVAAGVALVVFYNKSKTFRDIVQAAFRDVATAFDWVRDHAKLFAIGFGAAIALTAPPLAALVAGGIWVAKNWKTVWSGIQTVTSDVVNWIKGVIAPFVAWWQQHQQQIATITSKVWTLIYTYVKVGWDLVLGAVRPAMTILTSIFRTGWDVIKNVVGTAFRLINDVIHTGIQTTLDILGVVIDLLTGKWGKAWGEAKKFVTDAIHGIGKVIGDFASGAVRLLYQAGKDVIQGLVNGIKSMVGSAVNAVKGVGSSIVGGIKGLLGIKSPSVVFHGIGQNLMAGLSNGITANAAMAVNAARTAARQVAAAGTPGRLTVGVAAAYSGGNVSPLRVAASAYNNPTANKYSSTTTDAAAPLAALLGIQQQLSALTSTLQQHAGVSHADLASLGRGVGKLGDDIAQATLVQSRQGAKSGKK